MKIIELVIFTFLVISAGVFFTSISYILAELLGKVLGLIPSLQGEESDK